MAQKLKIIPLGGLDEIGKNLTVYEFGKDLIMVDCGMGFPDDEMYGVDVVIPDVSWLAQNKGRLRGIFLTHGHVYLPAAAALRGEGHPAGLRGAGGLQSGIRRRRHHAQGPGGPPGDVSFAAAQSDFPLRVAPGGWPVLFTYISL